MNKHPKPLQGVVELLQLKTNLQQMMNKEVVTCLHLLVSTRHYPLGI